MERNKVLSFIDKAITKTKGDELKWKRLNNQRIAFDNHFNEEYDLDNSFSSEYMGGSIILLYNSKSEEHFLALRPSSDIGITFLNPHDDDVDLKSQIRRLYNLVYRLFPNVDSFINKFIDVPNDENDDIDLPF